MDPVRLKRREEIQKSLTFIQSSLAYPDPEGYQDFLTKLVCNLLEEGNAFFKDRDWEQAVREFSEGLDVTLYAEAENLCVPEVLLESLFVNRATAYHSMGKYKNGLMDCDRALTVCKDSRRALYRKALCLKELGKYKEAYNCTTECLHVSCQDKQVNELAQELATHLGLKNRKPYVSSKEHALIMGGGANANMTTEVNEVQLPAAHFGNGVTPLSGTNFDLIIDSPVSSPVPDLLDSVDDFRLEGDELDNLLDFVPAAEESAEAFTQVPFLNPSKTSTGTHIDPFVLPPPTPQLPPAFFSSVSSQVSSLDHFAGGSTTTTVTLDALDDLSISGIRGGGASKLEKTVALDSLDTLDTLDDLDSLDDFSDMTSSAAAAAAAAAAADNESRAKPDMMKKSFNHLLDEFDTLEAVAEPAGVGAMDCLDSIDALDSFPTVEGSLCATAPVTRSSKNNSKERNRQAKVAAANPLSATHDFLQACSACFPQKGQGIYTFVHRPDLVHNCARNILLCRRKVAHPSEWTRVRPIPRWTSFSGPFVLCKHLLNSGAVGLCMEYGENCNFAFNQLEIDVWTEERKGRLDRNLLFETDAVRLDPVNSIIRLLQEHKGVFVFLCQKCYDSEPRIISKRCKDTHTICSNLDACHTFDANKCLVFVAGSYSKVRPLTALCHLDLCHQATHYGCRREDRCHYAHSPLELKTWRVQRHTGISPDEIVKVSTKYHEKQEHAGSKHKGNRVSSGGGGVNRPKGGGGGDGAAGKNLNLKMKFACAQCWRDGLINEPDKTLKYCTAKARHTWTTDKRLLLVKSPEKSKWVQVRPLPHAKNFPAYYDMCSHILKKRKCDYTGKCTFAHSQEEKEMWMYMKNNDLLDMQQIYDMWLNLNAHTRQADGAMLTQPVPEEKSIVMPTDYAEPMSGFYCHLCGKHSNSERQWQQHISSEKHKDRVFSCEDEDKALLWNCRFPGKYFQLCPKLNDGCADGVSCDYAHCLEELQEWTERRNFLRQKLAKARKDMLIMPNECDFGKYNFLLQD